MDKPFEWPGLAAVIVNYKSAPDALKLAKQLIAMGSGATIVVDNSSDKGEHRALKLGLTGLAKAFAVYPPENRGFGAGVNLGVTEARKRLPELTDLLICNTDIALLPGFLQAMKEARQKAPGALVSPRILTGNPGRPSYWYRGGTHNRSWGLVRMRSKGFPAQRRETGVVRANFAPATALLVPKNLFDQIGGFPENLFMYWEDVLFCESATARGAEIICALDATIWHQVGGSTRKNSVSERSVNFYYYMNRNRILCHPDYAKSVRFRVGTFVQNLRLRINILALDRADYKEKLQALKRGVSDGRSKMHSDQRSCKPRRRSLLTNSMDKLENPKSRMPEEPQVVKRPDTLPENDY